VSWEERYNEAIRIFLADHMSVLREEGLSIYGRDDWEAMQHMRTCMFDPEMLKGATVDEETVYEFAGTFEDSERAVVLHASPVSCICGHLKDRKGEWAGSFEDLIIAITGNTVKTNRITL